MKNRGRFEPKERVSLFMAFQEVISIRKKILREPDAGPSEGGMPGKHDQSHRLKEGIGHRREFWDNKNSENQ